MNNDRGVEILKTCILLDNFNDNVNIHRILEYAKKNMICTDELVDSGKITQNELEDKGVVSKPNEDGTPSYFGPDAYLEFEDKAYMIEHYKVWACDRENERSIEDKVKKQIDKNEGCLVYTEPNLSLHKLFKYIKSGFERRHDRKTKYKQNLYSLKLLNKAYDDITYILIVDCISKSLEFGLDDIGEVIFIDNEYKCEAAIDELLHGEKSNILKILRCGELKDFIESKVTKLKVDYVIIIFNDKYAFIIDYNKLPGDISTEESKTIEINRIHAEIYDNITVNDIADIEIIRHDNKA